MRRSALAALALAVAACGGPKIEDGAVECGPSGLCPPGFSCAADNLCYESGGPSFDAPDDDSCGNGVVELGETCDPIELCPADCDDSNECTNDVQLGMAQTCNVTCLHDTVSACEDGDGCCPATCSSANDDDCSASCGNGSLEAGETCDPPSSCPVSCNDGNACTTDTKLGSADNCNVSCSYTQVSACSDGDGCCPAGCNATNDSDCSASCGNGTVESGETCDPPSSCPISCTDGNACTIDSLTGSPANCNVACTFTSIVSCRGDDNCCPAGCTNADDNDCSASCGNGVIESGETCDPPSSCPTDCDDDNECTIDNRTGASSTCNVSCSHTSIVSCSDGDGCCPDGCNSLNDTDCSASCGNGVIESGETCDPPSSCPPACDDGDDCTTDTRTGSATNCNVRCTHSDITECIAGDACCPTSCIGESDVDTDCETGFCGDGFCDTSSENAADCPEDCAISIPDAGPGMDANDGGIDAGKDAGGGAMDAASGGFGDGGF